MRYCIRIAIFALLASAATGAAPDPRPNVLVIITDDKN
jgi:hypothetical protein